MGHWLAYPITLETQNQCEQGYKVIADEFEKDKLEEPEHICAQVVDLNKDKVE